MQMPNMLKGILIGGVGAIAGFIGGYLFARHQLQESYEAEVQNAIDEECERLRKVHEKSLEKSEEYKPNSPSGPIVLNPEDGCPVENLDEETNPYLRIVQRVQDAFWGTAHHSPSEVSGIGGEASAEEVDESEPESLAQQLNIYECEHGNDPPVLSDEEEFANLHPFYQPVCFEYYILDKVLLDENGQEVDNKALFVGDILDEVPPEAAYVPGVMYILNGQMGLGIEVTLRDASYYEEEGEY